MPKLFYKIKECGCIIKTITCGIKIIDKEKMYLIGGHDHLTICNKCKQDEEKGYDTLHDMWMNDNITNELEYAGWKEYWIERTLDEKNTG